MEAMTRAACTMDEAVSTVAIQETLSAADPGVHPARAAA
jgi:hypothetical protein